LTPMKVGDLVEIHADLFDKMLGRLGILVEEIESSRDEIIVSPGDEENPILSNEKFFSVYLNGRCYTYGDYELILVNSSVS